MNSAVPTPQRSSQLLARRILDTTSLLVRNAGQGNWAGAATAASHRRALFARLERETQVLDPSCMEALRQAVQESDAALAAMGPMQVAAPSVPVVR